MCLIFVAYQQHEQWPLILASNRDEFFQRASEPGHFWAPQFNLLGGRDQEQGGTWLAVNRAGRFAAVTNFRDPAQTMGERSRGHLVHDFVAGEMSAGEYLQQLKPEQYTGYNLLLGDTQSLHYSSNRGPGDQTLTAGVYGLSNHLLDTPWPKVTEGKQLFAEMVADAEFTVDRLFDLMADYQPAPADALPDTGIGADAERHLSSRFIPGWQPSPSEKLQGYGTRTTTVVLMNSQGHGHWFERNHSATAINRSETLGFSW